ncbi:MAG TPA: hypothetical protein VFG43_13710 [Geminicoccaceae bacterium]|nr:hypothetical protein [Geminicoccaceae bacterium]
MADEGGTLRALDYRSRRTELAGWPVRVTSYQLGDRFRSEVDNVDPGAVIARAEAASREEAEEIACTKATQRLGRTRTF